MSRAKPRRLRPIPAGAVEAAVSLARELGEPVDDPVVLANRANLVVHLRPAPVVARIVAATAGARSGRAWLEREVEVARHLVARSAPVVAPSRRVPPGPHERDGRVLSFWELAPLVEAPADPTEAGRGLRRCHDALRDLPFDLGQMGALSEARRIIVSLEGTGLLPPAAIAAARALGEGVEAALSGSGQPLVPLHGDAHLGNALSTSDGPRWVDFEDAFAGPPAWDLACLSMPARMGVADPAAAEAALRGYGAGALDDPLLEPMIDARAIQAVAWVAYYADRFDEPRDALVAQLDFLMQRARRRPSDRIG